MNFFFILEVTFGGAIIACLISSTPADGFTTTTTRTTTMATTVTKTTTQPTILTMTTNEFSKGTDDTTDKNNNIASSRRDILSNAGNVVVAAAAILGSEAILNNISDNSNNNNFVANAAEVDDTTTATSSYPTITGIYTDPNYPNGYRILIKKSEGFATLSYSDNDGDDNNVFTNRRVKINQDKSLTFDFSFHRKVGGQKNVVGIVDKDDGNSISFPDGTTWKRKDIYNSIEGVYGTDPRVATQGYRTVIIRKQKSDKNNNNVLVVELNKIKTITATIASDDNDKNKKKKKNGVDSIQFDFVPGDEQKMIEGTFQNGIISFPVPVQSNSYGNVFTKWDKWVKVGIQAY